MWIGVYTFNKIETTWKSISKSPPIKKVSEDFLLLSLVNKRFMMPAFINFLIWELLPIPTSSEHPIPKVFLLFLPSPIPRDHKTVHAKVDLNLFLCAIWWRLFVKAQWRWNISSTVALPGFSSFLFFFWKTLMALEEL